MGENPADAAETEHEYRCEACGRSFETREALLDHMCDQGQVG